MAMKDWFKDLESEDTIIWVHKKQDYPISVNKYSDGWHFTAFPKNSQMIKYEKLTKPQALAYAKKYMRTH